MKGSSNVGLTTEREDFEKSEQELLDVIDTLAGAIAILEKEMKGVASRLQLKKAGSVVEALTEKTQASSFHRRRQVVTLVPNSDDEENNNAEGAPVAAVYHVGGWRTDASSRPQRLQGTSYTCSSNRRKMR